MSDGYKEQAKSREHWDAKRDAEIERLRGLLREALDRAPGQPAATPNDERWRRLPSALRFIRQYNVPADAAALMDDAADAIESLFGRPADQQCGAT